MEEDDFFLPLPVIKTLNQNVADDTSPTLRSNVNRTLSHCVDDTRPIELEESDVNPASVREDELDVRENAVLIIKRILKKARLFEIRKVTRRISQLRKKKGSENELAKNERKIARMLQQVHALKDIRLEDLLQKIELMIGSKECNFEQLFEIDNLTGAKESSLFSLAAIQDQTLFATFLNSRSLKPKLIELFKNLQLGQLPNCVVNKPATDKDEVVDSNSTKIDQESSLLVHDVSRQKRKKMLQKMKDVSSIQHASLTNVEMHDLESRRNRSNESFKDIKKIKEKKILENNDIHIQGSSIKGCFLKKNKQQMPEIVAKLKGARGNRLGQRARREMWAKLYGLQAEHVKKGFPLQQRKQRNKGKRDQNGSLQNEITANKIKGSHNQLIKENASIEKLHPSWQAKKQQKQQARILEFQGNKILFD